MEDRGYRPNILPDTLLTRKSTFAERTVPKDIQSRGVNMRAFLSLGYFPSSVRWRVYTCLHSSRICSRWVSLHQWECYGHSTLCPVRTTTWRSSPYCNAWNCSWKRTFKILIFSVCRQELQNISICPDIKYKPDCFYFQFCDPM